MHDARLNRRLRDSGAGATVTVDYFGGFDEANGLAITADGEAVLAGFTDNSAGNADVAVARVTAVSGLDAGFGHVTYGYGAASTFDVGQAVAIEPGGKIDVAGTGGVANDFVLTRLTAAGALVLCWVRVGAPGAGWFGPAGVRSAGARCSPRGQEVGCGCAM